MDCESRNYTDRIVSIIPAASNIHNISSSEQHRPVITSSVSSNFTATKAGQFGAIRPNLMAPKIERLLPIGKSFRSEG